MMKLNKFYVMILILGVIHKLCSHLLGGGVRQMPTLLYNPYIVKVRVSENSKILDVIYADL